MGGAKVERRMTVEEFLEWHREQELRYELIDGVPVLRVKSPEQTDPRMMTGASPRHALIAGNIDRALGNMLEGGGCESYQSDAGVATAEDRTRYPDVVVDCSDDVPSGGLLPNPVAVLEILSRSTHQFDLRTKLAEYRQVPSIQVIVFVAQDYVEVEAHYRVEGDAWRTVRHLEIEEVLALPTLAVEVPLATIYRRVPLGPRPRPGPRAVLED